MIDQSGDNQGVMDTPAALDLAQNAGLDLVEISAGEKGIPICKIADRGRMMYEKQKKASEAKKKQKIVDTKEVKLRPNIDTHDYDTKMRNANKFLSNGDKVKFTMRFRGREMAHQNLGLAVLERIREDLADTIRVDAEPKLEGRQMMMVVSPKPQ